MSDNISILPSRPIHFDIFVYMSNEGLKKRLATRTNEQGINELYDSINGTVIMSGTMSLDSYLYKDKEQ